MLKLSADSELATQSGGENVLGRADRLYKLPEMEESLVSF